MAAVQLKGLEGVLKTLRSVSKQAEYATIQALNDTALDVQRDTVDRLLPSKFTLRSRGAPWWKPGTALGFNITFARRGRLESVIGSRADWTGLQEKGGTKTAAGHRLSIPQAARPTPTSVIPRQLKPRRLLRQGASFTPGNRLRKGAFVVRTRRGAVAIMQRTSPEDVRLLYTLKGSARVRARMQFIPTETKLANDRFSAHFNRRFAAALLTAR